MISDVIIWSENFKYFIAFRLKTEKKGKMCTEMLSNENLKSNSSWTT